MTDLVRYYGARAPEYEQVYAKPERQADLRILHDVIPAFFDRRRVLEVACGTGYWTRRIALRAAAITACDLSPDVLEIAKTSQGDSSIVTYTVADAYDLASVQGPHDSAFAGFWWSHIPRARLTDFVVNLHSRLQPDSRVMFVDNRYVEGSNQPISRTDVDGNTYQQRRLADGSAHEVLKNFPSAADVEATIRAAGVVEIKVAEWQYYWAATYLA